MSELAIVALSLGGVMAALYLLMVILPTWVMGWGARLHRNKWVGIVLTAAGLIWSCWLLMQMPLGKFENLKPWLYLITPVLFFMIINFMDAMLSVRAGGGILILAGSPMLDAARWHDSGFRYVIIVSAYLMVIKGMVLVLNPHIYRKWAGFILRSKSSCKAWGVAGLIVSMLLIGLGLFVF